MLYRIEVHARSWSVVLERSRRIQNWGPWRCYWFRGWLLSTRLGFENSHV